MDYHTQDARKRYISQLAGNAEAIALRLKIPLCQDDLFLEGTSEEQAKMLVDHVIHHDLYDAYEQVLQRLNLQATLGGGQLRAILVGSEGMPTALVRLVCSCFVETETRA